MMLEYLLMSHLINGSFSGMIVINIIFYSQLQSDRLFLLHVLGPPIEETFTVKVKLRKH